MKTRSSAPATRGILRFALAAVLMTPLIPVRAQTNVEVTNQLDVRTTPSATTKLELRYDGSLVSKGTFDPTATFSAGDLSLQSTFLWVPARAAFIAGDIQSGFIPGFLSASFSGSTATGDYSIASGEYSSASGYSSAVFGSEAAAGGAYSYAMGSMSSAWGYNAGALSSGVARGDNSLAHYGNAWGIASVALGGGSAIGDFSSALGRTSASSLSSTSVGRYNIGGGNATQWIGTDPLSEIGNGAAYNQKSNAFTVYKNGNAAVSGTLTVGGSPVLTANSGFGTNGITLNGTDNRLISVGAGALPSGWGGNLTISAGGANQSFPDAPGGKLILSSGASMGGSGSRISFSTSPITYGGWAATPAEKMVLNERGFLGIGTSDPTALLEVKGHHYNAQMRLFSDHYDEGINGSETSNLSLWASEPGISWDGAGIGNNVINSKWVSTVSPAYGYYTTGLDRVNMNKGGSYMRLLNSAVQIATIDAAGVTREAFYATPQGYVGMGTSGPGFPLEVSNGSASTQVSAKGATTGGTSKAGYNYNLDGYNLWQTFVDNTTGNDLNIQYSNTAKVLTVKPSGNVGIGSTVPAARLEVASVAGTDAFAVRTQTDANPQTPFRITADGKVLVRQQGDVGMGAFVGGAQP